MIEPKRIKEIRKAVGSQNKLGKLMGVNPRTIRGWESETRKPGRQSIEHLKEIEQKINNK